MVKQLRKKTNLIQWQNSDAVIEWFKGITNKKRKRFIQLNIVNFYPSITPELLEKSLDWAENNGSITSDERNVIKQAK